MWRYLFSINFAVACLSFTVAYGTDFSNQGLGKNLKGLFSVEDNSSDILMQGYSLGKGEPLTFISVNLFKRSDSETTGNSADTQKKKPKLYSWWMPNMTMSNSGSPTTEQSVTVPEPESPVTTTLPSSDAGTTRPTRKPRPTRPPRTRRPTKLPTTSTGQDETTTSTAGTTATTTTSLPSTSSYTTLATTGITLAIVEDKEEPSTSEDRYGVKRKFTKAAKTVGIVAVKAIGAIGSIAAVGASTGTGPIGQVAGKFGSAAKSVGSQATPIVLSAAAKVGSYAADAVGRALVRFAESLSNSSDNSLERAREATQVVVAKTQVGSDSSPSNYNDREEGKIITVYVQHSGNVNLSRMQNKNEMHQQQESHQFHKEDRMLVMNDAAVEEIIEMDKPMRQSKVDPSFDLDETLPTPTPVTPTTATTKKMIPEVFVPMNAKKMKNDPAGTATAIHKSGILITLISLGTSLTMSYYYYY